MDIKNTYKIRQTVLEMLSDRNYNIENIKNVDYDEFSIMYEENNYNIIDNDKKIYVIFFKETKTFNKKDLEMITQNAKTEFNENIKIIIVLKEKYNVPIEKELANALYKNVELFISKDLIFNRTKYNKIPKHIKMNENEITELLDKHKLNKNQLPKILLKDPISKYYGMKSGDIFKIIRFSTSSGEYKTYRYVR